MSARRQVTEIRVRKRLLVLQAELHRIALRTEWANARSRLSWLDKIRNKVRSVSPWLGASTAVLGLLAAGRGRKLALWAPTVFAVWRWVKKRKLPLE
jgi:hypothetical protein